MVPVSPTLALSAVKALLRFRGRIDSILALHEASAELPFALPPAPIDTDEHFDEMLAFYESPRGQLVLELRELGEDFERVKARPTAATNREARRRIFQVFYEATDTVPVVLGVEQRPALRAPQDMRLAFYVVASERLSKNPVVARVLLATADTLLEFAGENAGVLVHNPKTAAIVTTILDEFALQRDFDDASTADLFRALLGAAIVAVTEHGDELSDAPAVGALVRALSDFRAEFGDEAAARIVGLDGFTRLLGTFATHVADDPALLPDDPRLRAVLSATLREVGEQLPNVLADPTALLSVLEVTLTAAAGQVEDLLEGKLGNKPLIPQVLVAIAAEVERLGRADALLRSVADGAILGALLRTTLATIAENPTSLRTPARVQGLVATFVGQVGEVLAHRGLGQVFTRGSLREIVARGLQALADNPQALAIDGPFAAKVTTAVLGAAASAVEDGLTMDDLEALAGAAVRAATDNLRLLELDERLLAVLEATGEALADDGVRRLLTAQGRRDALLEVLHAVAANPVTWHGLADAELARPVVRAVFEALAADPSKLLSGAAWIAAVRRILTAAARRARRFLDNEVDPATLAQLCTMALRWAQRQIGETVDADNLPPLLERIVHDYLGEPFALAQINSADFKALVERAHAHVTAA